MIEMGIVSLADEIQEAGYKSLTWNASNVATGVYFYRIEAKSITDQKNIFEEAKKMILLK